MIMVEISKEEEESPHHKQAYLCIFLQPLIGF
jgi:hypothetical protein